jgi:hypothetical protein
VGSVLYRVALFTRVRTVCSVLYCIAWVTWVCLFQWNITSLRLRLGTYLPIPLQYVQFTADSRDHTYKDSDQKAHHFVNMSPLLRENAEHYKAFGISLVARIKAVLGSVWKYKNSIKSHTILLRADGVHLNIDEDYGLSKVGVFYQVHFAVRCPMFNPLETKHRLLYLNTQAIPHCKHVSSRLQNWSVYAVSDTVTACSQINTKHLNTLWAESKSVEY